MSDATGAVLGSAAAANPYMALGGAFLSGFGSSLAGSSAPSSAAVRGEQSFDSSGWNVNFGAGSIEATRSQAGELSEYMPYILVAAGLLVVWRVTRKR